ncbi:UNVERIFIED_CONTAM: hypothetical protein GTU68_046126 [Idotea baltica]|nr:hypothetical protein [Idotea baltica]
MPDLIILMGVSGCGKSTLGTILETTKGWRFLDGDDFHPLANKEKMGSGVPLTDDDRWPWFDVLQVESAKAIVESKDGNPVTLACSALKREYRDYLLAGFKNPLLIYLKGDRETIWGYVTSREHEYMQPSLLDSQFETLEEPNSEEENVFVLDIGEGVPAALEKLEAAFGDQG